MVYPGAALWAASWRLSGRDMCSRRQQLWSHDQPASHCVFLEHCACSSRECCLQATDSTGVVTRDPPFADPGDRQYYGTIVADPSDSSTLFVLEM